MADKNAQTQPTIFERLREIFALQLGVDEEEITLTSRFEQDLGGDSLDRVELIMAIEEAFDLEISDEEAEKIHTVQETVDYVTSHTKR